MASDEVMRREMPKMVVVVVAVVADLCSRGTTFYWVVETGVEEQHYYEIEFKDKLFKLHFSGEMDGTASTRVTQVEEMKEMKERQCSVII